MLRSDRLGPSRIHTQVSICEKIPGHEICGLTKRPQECGSLAIDHSVECLSSRYITYSHCIIPLLLVYCELYIKKTQDSCLILFSLVSPFFHKRCSVTLMVISGTIILVPYFKSSHCTSFEDKYPNELNIILDYMAPEQWPRLHTPLDQCNLW